MKRISDRTIICSGTFTVMVIVSLCFLGMVLYREMNDVEEANRLYMGIGLSLEDFASKNNGLYPLPDMCEVGFRLTERQVHTFGWIDLNDFYYIGYEVHNTREMEALLVVLAEQCSKRSQRKVDDAESAPIDTSLPRLRGTGCSPSTGYEVPVLIERPNAVKTRCLVLYLDNHVEYIDYPGKFPLSTDIVQRLAAWEQNNSRRI